MSSLAPTLFLGLLFAGAISFGLGSRPRVARALALGTAAAALAAAVTLFFAAADGERFVHAFGGWAPPLGIVFVVDRLSALFLLLITVLLSVTLLSLWLRARGADRNALSTAVRATPLLLLLSAGLVGAFLTGDLFNLFVMFELVLISSYLLLQVPGGRGATRVGFPVVGINLAASLLFFIGVGAFYSAFGSVNLAEIGARAQLPDPLGAGKAGAAGVSREILVDIGTACLFLAFATKSALVPFLAWLPLGYPRLHGPIAAFFSGLMTKLGVYAFLRVVPLLGSPWLSDVLVVVGAGSAILGVLAALAQYDLRRLLGFHIVSQVGYMILGLGLSTLLGLTGAIFYLVHHVLVKASLFFVADELETESGTRDLRGMFTRRKWLVLFFCLAAGSLAGLPPLSGFLAKVGLFRSTLEIGAWPLVTALVVASFGTLASMTKIWRYAFSGARAESGAGSSDHAASTDGAGSSTSDGRALRSAGPDGLRWLPLGILVTLSLLVSIGGGFVWDQAAATADQLLDVEGYVDAVLRFGGRGEETIELERLLQIGGER